MTALVDMLSSQALELAPAERVLLAERLLATVHASDPEVDGAWDEEIRRRIAEIDDGSAQLIHADEVFAEVRRILR